MARLGFSQIIFVWELEAGSRTDYGLRIAEADGLETRTRPAIMFGDNEFSASERD